MDPENESRIPVKPDPHVHSAPVFETLAILDDTQIDPETRVPIPSEAAIMQAKGWVDENRL